MTARQDLKKIYQAAIEAVNSEKAIHDNLRLKNNILEVYAGDKPIKAFDLDGFKKIFVIGAGKATASMARAVEDLLGSRIYAGCICVKYGHTRNLSVIETIEAGHPLPDENSIAGAQRIKHLLESASADDLVISLISGGGSALLCLPPENVTLEEKKKVTDLLIKSGAAIHEINAVRKHLSCVKGGNLAKAAHPATVLNLMISDVVGDRIDTIASGPFVVDTATFSHALGVIGKYNLIRKIPPSALAHIAEGANSEMRQDTCQTNAAQGDTPSLMHKITHLIIASNIICLEAAKKKAIELGYHSLILSSAIEGDTRTAAAWHAQIAREVLSSSNPVPMPACIISGGETTVRVEGEGKGGRNMEFAMQAAPFIAGFKNLMIASIGTDGTDGPTDAAGAVAHGFTLKKAAGRGIDINEYMRNNDSYHFFKLLEDLIVTGPTHTNVMDIRIILVSTEP
jgi:hydroxypyruvate reductase